MAVGGPYFSDLLLLVMYHSGVRFSPHLNEEDRGQRRAQYMAIIMSIIAEELCKPSSIATARTYLVSQVLPGFPLTPSSRGLPPPRWYPLRHR